MKCYYAINGNYKCNKEKEVNNKEKEVNNKEVNNNKSCNCMDSKDNNITEDFRWKWQPPKWGNGFWK